MENVGIFYGHLEYFTAFRYTHFMTVGRWPLVIWHISPVLLCCAKKNLATLVYISTQNRVEIS
jgi:hypothetical protein